MTSSSKQKLKIFYSYSHKDQKYREQLENHLSNLKRLYHLQTWFDREIKAGDNWEEVLEEHLNTADLIFLLVSPDFMSSGYCYNKEMTRALERHAKGEVKVIPILVRHVHWADAPFSHIQLLPTDARPIKSRADPDKAFYNIVIEVEKAIKELLSETQQTSSIRNKAPSNFQNGNLQISEQHKETTTSPELYDEYRDYQKIHFTLAQRVQKDFEIFDDALRRSFPGRLDYIQARNEKEINRTMNSLIKCAEKGNLWWSQGRRSNPCPIKHLENNIWLLDIFECHIQDLWAYRSPRIDRQHIIIHLAPQQPFDINHHGDIAEYIKHRSEESSREIPYDYAGFFKGKYIPLAEREDGYTVIDDEIVELDGTSEVRWRNLMDEFFILTPQFGPSNDLPRSEEIEAILNRMRLKGKIGPEMLEALPTFEPLALRRRDIYIDY